MRLIAGALLILLIAGCGGGSSGVQHDQEFLQLTGQDSSWGVVDAATRVHLGHDMCTQLAKHHGDTAAAGAELAAGAPTLTPSMMDALASDAAVAYCPKWR